MIDNSNPWLYYIESSEKINLQTYDRSANRLVLKRQNTDKILQFFDISPETFYEKGRKLELHYLRCIIAYYAKHEAKMTLASITPIVSRVNHATILNQLKAFEGFLISNDYDFLVCLWLFEKICNLRFRHKTITERLDAFKEKNKYIDFEEFKINFRTSLAFKFPKYKKLTYEELRQTTL